MKRLTLAQTALAAAALVLAASGAQAATLVNGNFEAGNTGFNSDYGFVPATHNALYPEGIYTIGSNPNGVHDQWSSFGDHTTGEGLMMIVNGAPDADQWVWQETGITVAQNTTYFFSTWVASSHPANPAVLNFAINGQVIGGLTASASTGQWQQFYGTWNSGSATTADLALVNNNTIRFGNDFVLDDIAFGTTRPGDGVPEPAVWTMMILGFGSAGAMLRRRRQAAAAA